MKNKRFNSIVFEAIRRWISYFILGISLLITGCASKPLIDINDEKIFYPPLPNPPRIQYLKTFTSQDDLVEKTGGLSEFILGTTNAPSLIIKPYGVAINNGQLFAVDTRGPGYVIFDFATKKAETFNGRGRIKKPINIVLDKDNNRYVTDTQLDQVLVFDNQNKFLRAYGVKGQFKPTDLLIVDNKMFVVDILHHKIHVLSLSDGSTLYEIGRAGSSLAEKGSKDIEFFHPTNIKIGPDDNLYVSDTGNFRIQVITQQGEFVRSVGRVGNGPGQFARPKGIATDKQGNLYVVDAAFNNIQVFLPSNELVLVFGGPGNEPGNLDLPTDIEIDYDNISWFQQYADPNFKLEYVIVVANQFGNHKVTVYGYGKMRNMRY